MLANSINFKDLVDTSRKMEPVSKYLWEGGDIGEGLLCSYKGMQNSFKGEN